MKKNSVGVLSAACIDEIISDAERWAKSTAQIARRSFRQPINISYKSDESPVTTADCQIEKELKKLILEKYPNSGIFGEESGVNGDMSQDFWVIDPIDGTRSFISGNPLFGMLLSYVSNGLPVAGIISMPVLQEIYSGGVERAATCNGVSIRVSDKKRLQDSIIYINEGEKLLYEHPDKFERLLKVGRTFRFGYDCYPHALLAAGCIDVVVDYDLKPYDYLALSSVVEAAGGIMSDWNGAPLNMSSDGSVVSCASPEIHQAMLAILGD